MSLSRVFLYSSALTFIANYAIAKYCVKLPTCEELGYIYSADKYPNNRSIKCPFDTKKILLLDYCQAYGLTSCDSTSGECDECIVEKADGTKSNSGYWRYTRCNAGYSYKSGECPPTEVDTSKYPLRPEQMNEEIGEVECVQSAQNVYCGYKSCNEGWDINSGNCIVHQCDAAQYPNSSCDENGTCETCKAGADIRYSEATCNLGYFKINGICTPPCSTVGTCKIGDIYAYNNAAIGVVFYNDNITTKIVALTNVDTTGYATTSVSARMSWANETDYSWNTGATQSSVASSAFIDKNGKYNTNKILSYISNNSKAAEAATATNIYAPNICGSGSICSKGKWYLPAAGELEIQYSNRDVINTSLSNIGGSIINSGIMWSSTETSISNAWGLKFDDGAQVNYAKYYRLGVRPALQLCAESKYLSSDGTCTTYSQTNLPANCTFADSYTINGIKYYSDKCITCASGFEPDGSGGCKSSCAYTNTSLPSGCSAAADSCSKDGKTYYSTTCKTCKSGWYLSNGSCKANTCSGYYDDYVTLEYCNDYNFDICYSGYTTKIYCYSCRSPYTAQYGLCINSCVAQGYEDRGCCSYHDPAEIEYCPEDSSYMRCPWKSEGNCEVL